MNSKIDYIQIGYLIGKYAPHTTLPISQDEVEDMLRNEFGISPHQNDSPGLIVTKLLDVVVNEATGEPFIKQQDDPTASYDRAMKGIG